MDSTFTWIVAFIFLVLLTLFAAGSGCESRTFSLNEFACAAPTKETK
ncbi:hypothetical protein DSS3P8_166 [Roseobacter phage DSS3P8]|nr:hypothetical protein DSS3P8_166 [Roseobacter phage DSS3P8]